ncbi:MAG TPA: DUF2752 domain-containing protein [Cytophagales bacterium]|nr:DUF2752 domain-containing protein [Cytophagales bacterium]
MSITARFPFYANVCLAYVRANYVTSIFLLYFLFSCLLKISTGIDLCIPCLWKTLFAVQCPGCGLTSAFIHLLQLEFSAAYAVNPLVYLIAPVAAFYIVWDFVQFKATRSVIASQA